MCLCAVGATLDNNGKCLYSEDRSHVYSPDERERERERAFSAHNWPPIGSVDERREQVLLADYCCCCCFSCC